MPKDEPIPLTAEGRTGLEDELRQLRDEQRPVIVARVAETRAQGDLRENFGYHDARRELGMLDGRIATIEHTLRHAVIIEAPAEAGRVHLGSRVTVRDEWGESTYSIVGQVEADAAKGLISAESPLGAALMGCGAGDIVSVAAPNGTREVTVVDVA